MIVPEGYFDAGGRANGQGVIDSWACHDDLSITKLWIPNTITLIGNNAFSGCANLEAIIFEKGENVPLSIGLMSFANCASLRAVSLPARTVSVGKGCFRECIALEDVEIGEGLSPLSLENHLFDNCPGKISMEETLANEAERRAELQHHQPLTTVRRRAIPINTLLQGLRLRMSKDTLDREAISVCLQNLYAMMGSDGDFNVEEYVRKYGAACEHYSAVLDWNQASDDELQKLLIRKDFAKKVAYVDWGEIPMNQYECSDKAALRQIAATIVAFKGDDCEDVIVEKLEELFCSLFTDKRHPAAFYRTIAGLCPQLVVPVPAIAKLAPVYAWLVGVEYESALALGWYKLSRIVRTNLQSLLPGKTVYEVGVLAWYLAEAFRDDLGKNRQDALRRKEKVLAVLHESGLV
jgi:hypothetical protein